LKLQDFSKVMPLLTSRPVSESSTPSGSTPAGTCLRHPPARASLSMTFTVKPSACRSWAAISPAGPLPTTATLPVAARPLLAGSVKEISPRKASMEWMDTEAPFLDNTQAYSQKRWEGQSLPVMDASGLLSLSSAQASSSLPDDTRERTEGMPTPMGQPPVQPGSWHCRQAEETPMACLRAARPIRRFFLSPCPTIWPLAPLFLILTLCRWSIF